MNEKLLQTPTEGIPKSVDDIVGFIESLQNDGRVKIYAAHRHSFEHRISLSPVQRIGEKQPYFVVDSNNLKNKYHVFAETKSVDHDAKDHYGVVKHAVIERLSPELAAQRILVAYSGKLIIPNDAVLIRIKLSYTEMWKCAMIDYKVSSVSEMSVEHSPSGSNADDFLGRVCRFARGEKIN
ncbi:hypothetical protein HY485_03575 [Candidatus Woesearchaeota archaeon]|nr:hypothetical protein [Candidatus Woesearchaeota archaeon]